MNGIVPAIQGTNSPPVFSPTDPRLVRNPAHPRALNAEDIRKEVIRLGQVFVTTILLEDGIPRGVTDVLLFRPFSEEEVNSFTAELVKSHPHRYTVAVHGMVTDRLGRGGPPELGLIDGVSHGLMPSQNGKWRESRIMVRLDDLPAVLGLSNQEAREYISSLCNLMDRLHTLR